MSTPNPPASQQDIHQEEGISLNTTAEVKDSANTRTSEIGNNTTPGAANTPATTTTNTKGVQESSKKIDWSEEPEEFSDKELQQAKDQVYEKIPAHVSVASDEVTTNPSTSEDATTEQVRKQISKLQIKRLALLEVARIRADQTAKSSPKSSKEIAEDGSWTEIVNSKKKQMLDKQGSTVIGIAADTQTPHSRGTENNRGASEHSSEDNLDRVKQITEESENRQTVRLKGFKDSCMRHLDDHYVPKERFDALKRDNDIIKEDVSDLREHMEKLKEWVDKSLKTVKDQFDHISMAIGKMHDTVEVTKKGARDASGSSLEKIQALQRQIRDLERTVYEGPQMGYGSQC